jgi:hypothetical protein
VNKKRLQLAVDTLRNKVTNKQFNIDWWMDISPCRTTGCVAGWYAYHNPRSGLFIDNKYDEPRLKSDPALHPIDAVQKHFELNDAEFYYIFHFDGKRAAYTRLRRAARIQKFINTNGKSMEQR